MLLPGEHILLLRQSFGLYAASTGEARWLNDYCSEANWLQASIWGCLPIQARANC